ncbi:MAG: pentapeptide repeat-containing protein [Actinomycetia bacterium]|nr:pentapeptide repeat-containing protein [Actinomycetes bacterium]
MPWLDPPDPFTKPPRLGPWPGRRQVGATDIEVIDGWCDIDGVHLTGAELDVTEAETVVISGSRLDGVTLVLGPHTGVRFLRAELVGCVLATATIESLIGTRLASCDLRGAVFTNTVRDVEFTAGQLSHSYWAGASLERVLIEGCVLRETDFHMASLTDVAFEGCEMEGVNFDASQCERVDLRGTNLDLVGIRDLTGCLVTIDQVQAIALQLADMVGLSIENPDPSPG